MKRCSFLSLATFALVVLLSGAALAQWDEVEIKLTPVAGNIHLLEGRGGKIAVCAGEDGAFLVDAQFSQLNEKITAAVATLDTKPIRFILNTHWHGDHAGGNENFGNQGVILVAHNNVRQRLSERQFVKFVKRETMPHPMVARPIVTFTDEIEFHMNGEDILAMHVNPAHTDGDAVVFFRNANVVHGGDVYWGGMYPFIDLSSGGSIDGFVEASHKLLALVDDQTRIIPGHGPVGGRAELQAFHDMLKSVRAAIQSAIDEGASLEETIGRKPTAAYDEEWGQGWIKPDEMVTFVYESLTEE